MRPCPDVPRRTLTVCIAYTDPNFSNVGPTFLLMTYVEECWAHMV